MSRTLGNFGELFISRLAFFPSSSSYSFFFLLLFPCLSLCVLFVLQFSSIILMQQICRRISCSKEFFHIFFFSVFFYDFYFCQFTTHTHELCQCVNGGISRGLKRCEAVETGDIADLWQQEINQKWRQQKHRKKKEKIAGITKGTRDAHQFMCVCVLAHMCCICNGVCVCVCGEGRSVGVPCLSDFCVCLVQCKQRTMLPCHAL